MDNEREIIELTGEGGDTIKAEYLDTVLVDDNEYVVLLPVDEDACSCCDGEDCDSEVIIMKIEKNGEEEYLVPVEDEMELEKAFDAFQDQMDEYEDDEEEEEESEDKDE